MILPTPQKKPPDHAPEEHQHNRVDVFCEENRGDCESDGTSNDIKGQRVRQVEAGGFSDRMDARQHQADRDWRHAALD